MKKTIDTMEEALIMELENLYCSEKKLAIGLAHLGALLHSEKVHPILTKYVNSADHKQLKIDRIFSCLYHEPKACHTNVIDELINETRSRIKFTQDCCFQDLLLVTCLQRLNNYMLCAYRASRHYAEVLELDTPVELLEMMIDWDEKAATELTQLADFNFKTTSLKEVLHDNATDEVGN